MKDISFQLNFAVEEKKIHIRDNSLEQELTE